MKKFVLYAIVFLLLISFSGSLFEDESVCGESLNKEEIRLRIIGKSDDTKDLKIKNQIKEECFKILENIIKEQDDYLVVINKLKLNIILLEERVKKIDENVNISLDIHKYPLKISGEKLEYEREVVTILVKISEAKGSNYFTTLYPNFIQAEEKEVKYESFFKNLLEKLKAGD